MIEQGIFFALGCIITGLAALAFAPLFWRRALRLTRRRLQLQVPLSLQEILAERDGLRAQFAVEHLRIEQEMDRVRASKTADMLEIGRHSVAAAALSDQLGASRAVERRQDAEIDRLNRDLAETAAEAGAIKIAFHEASSRLERHGREAEIFATDRRRLEDIAETRRVQLAALEAGAIEREARLHELQSSGATREEGLAASMRNRLESAMAQASRHEMSGLSLRRELDEARARIRLLEDATEARQAEMALAPAIAPQAPADEDEADAGLRASIHALGLAVAKMTRETRHDNSMAQWARQTTPAPIDAD